MTAHPDDGARSPGAALDRLGRIRLTEHSMRSLLGEIAELAQQSLPGRLETSVTLLTGDAPVTAVATGPLARELDQAQYGSGAGPCLHAASRGEVVEIRDMRAEERWTEFREQAVQHGCLSSLSLPLPLHEAVSGSLNIYAQEPSTFDEPARDFAQRFASYGAVVAGNMLVYESALDRARNLEAAMASRAIIDQAKGILMERFKLTADQAFRALTRVSMETNKKVRDIAARFVDTGELDRRPPQ
ncbi:GAF and ANTAR domain-containing protein [Blastococcus sp. CT_GayMR16]|uniref:GAF and ANTAR domain-containing protein n=1 Tax=Blastococcus sp. CT_GayMR16 TaxID=2559607 RepID=UPI001073A023|nr:GAF and ANTAR domain-containing protein [Blastococcus sp. CT_GayMR16]TFV88742.1 ANTAR domain-containing protein [Blastococcus sp. CT_GayMR16]